LSTAPRARIKCTQLLFCLWIDYNALNRYTDVD
jgi:hypothetical protein